MQQYFVLNDNNKLRLKDEDYYHLVTVLRATVKRKIVCVLDNKRYLCEFTKLDNDYEINIINEIVGNTELEKDITLCQALIKSDNFELVLQKATELGVKTIIPTSFERSVLKITSDKEESKLKRYSLIIKGASEQSHRDIIPLVTSVKTIKELTLDNDELGLICYEKCDSSINLSTVEELINDYSKIKVVIGPEGGITTKELDILIDKGFKMVSLGKRILRSETASMSVLSILSYIIEK